MGLDVYLTRISDVAKLDAGEKLHNELSEAIWNDVGVEYWQMTDEQKETARKRVDEMEKERGFDDDGKPSDVEKESISIKSTIHPDHMFEIGYFRSSYNQGGINTVLKNTIGLDGGLYAIFQEANEEGAYRFRPDWIAARDRAIKAAADLRAFAARSHKLSVDRLRYNQFADPSLVIKDGKQALDAAIQALDDHAKRSLDPVFETEGRWYSSAQGHFYLKPPAQVVAVFPGVTESLFGKGVEPCVYVVRQGKEDPYEWYAQALDVVVETCDYVLNHPQRDQMHLRWSS